jgi:hypothetical protein
MASWLFWSHSVLSGICAGGNATQRVHCGLLRISPAIITAALAIKEQSTGRLLAAGGAQRRLYLLSGGDLIMTALIVSAFGL